MLCVYGVIEGRANPPAIAHKTMLLYECAPACAVSVCTAIVNVMDHSSHCSLYNRPPFCPDLMAMCARLYDASTPYLT